MPSGHASPSSDPNLSPAPIPSDGAAALEDTYKALEQKALVAMRWYEARQRSKKLGARLTRGGAIVLGAITTIVPSLIAMLPEKLSFWGFHDFPAIKLNPLATILGVLSATTILLDRFYGYSSSWMRYVTTYQEIQANLDEFRIDWRKQLLRLNSNRPPTDEQILGIYDFFASFLRSVNDSVRSETQGWVTEFKGALTDVDRLVQGQRGAALTRAHVAGGGLNVTVQDYETLDGRRWTLQLDNREPEARVGQHVAPHVGALEVGVDAALEVVVMQLAGQATVDERDIEVTLNVGRGAQDLDSHGLPRACQNSET